MTPEKQRIAIAEACGWTVEDSHVRGGKNLLLNGVLKHSEWFNDACKPTLMLMRPWLPDYLSDLNAMHEAEKVLTPDQKRHYTFNLFKALTKVTAVDLGYEDLKLKGVSLTCVFAIVHATATQRAQPFLRTIGKWEDSK